MLGNIKDRLFGARQNNSPLLWLNAEHGLTVARTSFKTRGEYRYGWPQGAVIHYTAGSGAAGAEAEAQKHGYSYFIISTNGSVVQGAPLNRWGSHAGESSWPGLGSWVSQYLVGIEVVCPGLLKQTPAGELFTWYGAKWTGSANQDEQGRWFAAFTKAQQESLFQLLLVLKVLRPEVFNFDYVLGHCEVSPGRKEDPGASLGIPLAQLRSDLHKRWAGA